MFKWKKWFLPLIDIVFQEIKIESCYIHVSKWEFKQNKTKKTEKKKNKKELGVKKRHGPRPSDFSSYFLKGASTMEKYWNLSDQS